LDCAIHIENNFYHEAHEKSEGFLAISYTSLPLWQIKLLDISQFFRAQKYKHLQHMN